jgi:uncharacterized membrane-anchored protein YitT (DUF2179 family)
MLTRINKKDFTIKIIKDSLAVIIGALLGAFALYSFILPNKYVTGGVSGIAIILENVGISKTYITQLIMNIPLLIASLIFLHKDFAVKTIACTFLISFFMGLMEKYNFLKFTEDRLLSSLYSGIIYGIGLGMLYERGGSSGGSEIIANLIIRKNPSAKVSKLIMVMDVAVILFGLTVFDAWSVAYAIISSVTCEKIMAFYLGRGRLCGAYFLITDKPDVICEEINKKFSREGIHISAIGSYTKTSKALLQLFLPVGNVNKVKDIIERKDSNAFSFVIPSRGISKENKVK